MNRPHPSSPPGAASRYTISHEIASGGMATVYAGRLAGPGGFSRPVAIKRPHAHVAKHPEFRAMLLDEGRLAASISHPNVVSTLDVVADGDDLFLVMEYVPGRTLSELQRLARKRGETVPLAVTVSVIHGVLLGLSAVHDARDEHGAPLGIVHRDISPQNILVGRDGVARLLDFGVAKAAGRLQVTRAGEIKGKIAYMAPEQMQGRATAASDLYSVSVVLWEALTGQRLFTGTDDVEVFANALTARVAAPSQRSLSTAARDPEVWEKLDTLVLRGLSRNPDGRFPSASEMAAALEGCTPPATAAEVRAWLESVDDPPKPADAEGASTSSGITVAEAHVVPPAETVTEPAPEAPPARVSEKVLASVAAVVNAPRAVPAVVRASTVTAPRTSRGRRVVMVGLAVVAAALISTLAVWRSTSEVASAAATSTSALGGGSSPSPPSALPVAASGASSAPAASSEATKEPPRRRDVPGPRSGADRRRAPGSAPAIDVSHAIDARH